MTAKNSNVFAALAGNTYLVPLPSLGNNEALALACRPVPYACMTHVLVTAATELQDEISQALRVLIEEMTSQSTGASDAEVGGKILAQLMPSIARLLATSVPLLHHVLRNVIVDADENTIHNLSTEDAMCVLSTAINKIDMAVLGKHIGELFFFSRGTVTTIAALSAQKGTPTPQA
jgi:hypothetical protein